MFTAIKHLIDPEFTFDFSYRSKTNGIAINVQSREFEDIYSFIFADLGDPSAMLHLGFSLAERQADLKAKIKEARLKAAQDKAEAETEGDPETAAAED